MPLYEYQCDQCGRFEVIRKFSDEPLTVCPTCGKTIQKLLSSPAIQFKGTGWYVTDYAKSGSKDAKSSGGKAEGGKSEGNKSEGGKSEGAKAEGGKAEGGSKAESAKDSGSKSKGDSGGGGADSAKS